MSNEPSQKPRRLRNRRGAVLVWFGISITTLLMVTAVVLDFSYWYAATQELQTAADAAALRGARMLQFSTAVDPETDVDSAAVNFSPVNDAQLADVTITASQVQLAWWTPTPPGGIPGEPNLDPSTWPASATRANAVVVTNQQLGESLIGRIFNWQTPNLGRRAVAWIAYLNAGRCLRPWGMPMSQVVWKVTDEADSSYRELTPAEVGTMAEMTPEELTIVMVPPRKTLPPSVDFASLPPNTGEWAGFRLDNEATNTGNQGMDEFNRLSAGGCVTSNDAYGVGEYANTDLPAGSLESFMQDALEDGYKQELGPTCVYANGSANCYADNAAMAANEIGVRVNVAYTSSPGANGSEPIRAYMLGEFMLMCVFTKATDTCGWNPSPYANTGYPTGTIVGYPIADFFTKLREDIEWGNVPSTSSRLFLVK